MREKGQSSLGNGKWPEGRRRRPSRGPQTQKATRHDGVTQLLISWSCRPPADLLLMGPDSTVSSLLCWPRTYIRCKGSGVSHHLQQGGSSKIVSSIANLHLVNLLNYYDTMRPVSVVFKPSRSFRISSPYPGQVNKTVAAAVKTFNTKASYFVIFSSKRYIRLMTFVMKTLLSVEIVL